MTNYFTSKFGGINKVNRQIPNEVFSWNYEAKLAFFAGMIDADGYVNSHQNENNFSTVQIGSTNKELALQQMALAQSIGIPAKIYHNHYTKKNPELIRYIGTNYWGKGRTQEIKERYVHMTDIAEDL